MALQLLLNLALAIVWMFLSSSYSVSAFIIGFLLGLVCLYCLRSLMPGTFYFQPVWAFIKLAVLFLKELILANIAVVKVVLKPQLSIEPAFFKYETTLTKDWEITLLSSLITLTPGTVVVHLSDDSKSLFIHAVDVQDVEQTIISIRETFEKAILEVSKK